MCFNLCCYIYMNEICDVAGVSECVLCYVFEDLFGILLNWYLLMLCFCVVCCGLLMVDFSCKLVKVIVLSCGLWDLFCFVDNYCCVFGELFCDILMWVLV